MRSALRVAVAVFVVALGVAAWLWLSRVNAAPSPIGEFRLVLAAAGFVYGRLQPLGLLLALGLGQAKPERRLAVTAR